MSHIRQFVLGGLAVALMTLATTTADAGLFCHKAKDCCEPAPTCCEPEPVCCPTPPPVEVEWCVKDPCTCCTYKVSACVPACCAGVEPCLDGCRKGLFGRKILTYKFPGCDHCVDVVITKHGRTIVRD